MAEIKQRIRTYLAITFHFSDAQIEQMAPGFFVTLRGHLETLERAIAEDPAQTARAAHTMKGALLNLGLEAEAAIALELEKRGNAGASDIASLTLLARNLRKKLTGL